MSANVGRRQRGKTAGLARERKVKELKEKQGWVCIAAKGSLGPVDLVAIRRGLIEFIEVKSTVDGPYKNFSPQDRQELLEVAGRAGAVPILCWWPPRCEPQWITSGEWP